MVHKGEPRTPADSSRAADSAREPHGKQLTDFDAFLACLVNSTEEAIIGISLDGHVFSWNTGAERLFGYTRDEMIGRKVDVLTPEHLLNETASIMDDIRAARNPGYLETVRLTKDGEEVHVSLNLSVIKDDAGNVYGASGIARDVTERINGEKTIRETIARLRAIFHTAVDGIITIDPKGIIDSVNPAALRMFGYDKNEVIGRKINVLMPEPYCSEHDTFIANYLRTGERKIIGLGREVRGLRKDGTEFPMELAVSESKLPDGRILFTGIVRDITERLQAEQALRESERRFRLMADRSPVKIWVSGVDKRITWLNERWLAFTGRTLHEELGERWLERVHPQDRERCRNTYINAFENREPFEMEFRLLRHDGGYRWIRDAGVPIHWEDGTFAGYVGSGVDITDQKLGEEALRERVAQRTRELSEANNRLRHEIEERTRIDSLLQAENKILELIVSSTDHAKLLDQICARVERLLPHTQCAIRLNGKLDVAPSRGTQTDGDPRMGIELFGAPDAAQALPPHAEVTTNAEIPTNAAASSPGSGDTADDRSRTCVMEKVIGTGGAVLGTLGILGPGVDERGRDTRPVMVMAARLTGVVVERARAEARAQEHLAHLAHVARLATTGEMASELAHELNQPLCAIVNFTEACGELIRRGNTRSETLVETLDEVSRQAERAGEVIRRMRDFVRRRKPEHTSVNIHELIHTVLRFVAVELRHAQVDVNVNEGARPPNVLADSIQIEQVLVNLIRNARDAMSEIADEKRVLVIDTLKHDNVVEVRITDSGPGIPAAIENRLFEPFFSTKPDGMGLGLSITRSLLDAHEGSLWFSTAQPLGTTVHFTLPAIGREHDD